METPIRIQRKRTRGWTMPENTVYVGRPSKWGNPYIVKAFINGSGHVRYVDTHYLLEISETGGWREEKDARHHAVYRMYKIYLTNRILRGELNLEEIRGKNLACWCKVGEICHADVLLEMANQKTPS